MAANGDSRQNRESAEAHKKLAEVGPLPPVANPERREFCRTDLHAFLLSYFPETTGRAPFSEDQKGAILRMQLAIMNGGGRVLNLFPRGFGKTTISENAALWAILYGHRRFIPIIGADEHAAKDNIESIKTELMTNELLQEDFPEVSACVLHLENKAQRARSQTQNGNPTFIQWGQDTLVLPSIKTATGFRYYRRPANGHLCIESGTVHEAAKSDPQGRVKAGRSHRANQRRDERHCDR